ncbi:hypothetical protein PPERSA_07545 [Pseudocohnilembus persalinus]|uniref:Uncharacterized protein n=1 Tax=Pseudocohnilembus persalinus TaxID=266149 RepID=A0A0V0QZS4_PSEPJ|nr:hypothetical protein PPERSA_07545 [Pseudocohnilembus persalinus]|eukprot:KRX07795.1 hypothetical protein PPERSA_07545 [Pseudocohnilembus persalinus]
MAEKQQKKDDEIIFLFIYRQSQLNNSVKDQNTLQNDISNASINKTFNVMTEENESKIKHLIKRRLLFNNTMSREKDNKKDVLECVIQNDGRLKDSLGKYLFDNNGTAIYFSLEQIYQLEKQKLIRILEQ